MPRYILAVGGKRQYHIYTLAVGGKAPEDNKEKHMNKTEILQHVAYNHNILADMLVKGDNAIIVGKVLESMRALAEQLQADIQSEIAMA